MGCAAALATIEVLSADGFLDQVNQRGKQLADGLRRLQEQHSAIVQVRALGLMIAAQFDTATRTSAIVSHLLRQGKLITMTAGAAGTTLRFMPPLTVTAEEIDTALAALDKALVEVSLG
jgi:4-aminobutyrate aminotransferase-like enzyme